MKVRYSQRMWTFLKIDSEHAIYEDGEHTVEFLLPSRGIHALMLPHVDQRLAAGLKPAKVS